MRHHLSGHAPIGLARPAPAPDRQNSDEALVAKVAAGNRLAMQALFARHHTRVYRFVLRLIGNEALAEDVTARHSCASGSRPSASRRARASPPGSLRLHATRPSQSCGTGASCRRTRRRTKPRTRRTIRRPPMQSDTAAQSSAPALPGSRASSAPSSIWSTITKSRCRKWRRSWTSRATPSKRACSTRGESSPSCSCGGAWRTRLCSISSVRQDGAERDESVIPLCFFV